MDVDNLLASAGLGVGFVVTDDDGRALALGAAEALWGSGLDGQQVSDLGLDPGRFDVEGRVIEVSAHPEVQGAWVLADASRLHEAEQRADEAVFCLKLARRRGALQAFLFEARAFARRGADDVEAALAGFEHILSGARSFGLDGVAYAAACVLEDGGFDEDGRASILSALEAFVEAYGEVLGLEFPEDPVADVVEGFSALAEHHGRKVRLQVEGTPERALGGVLGLLGPLVENAVEHGIEASDDRGGKPEVGTVVVRFESQEGFATLVVDDDGRGVDVDDVADRAVARGLVEPDRAAELAPHERLAVAFLEGIGRPLGTQAGLSRVRAQVEEVGGHLELRTGPGRGTTIKVHVPA